MDLLKILSKYINNSLNADETSLLDRISKGNGSHARLYRIVQYYFNYQLPSGMRPNKDRMHKIIQRNTLDFTLTDPQENSKGLRKLSFVYYAAAASVVLLLSLGVWRHLDRSGDEFEIVVEASLAETRNVLLPDSSKVFLNAGSSIRYQKDFLKNRQVKLSGEAFFDVKKYHKSTFRVLADNFNVVVLGTSFNIKTYAQQASEVKLYTGRINFELPVLKKVIAMHPMERIIYEPQTLEIKLDKFENEDFDWRTGKYKFTDIPLSEIISIINENYNVKILLQEHKVGTSLFSGAISKNEPLEDVLDKICISTGLRKTIKGDSITLY